MIYAFKNTDKFTAISPMSDLEITEVDSPQLMARLGKITLAESRNRFAEDNKAFVAYINGIPAAFGWMAMGKAIIGELNHEFILPLFHRYLWNFRTFEPFRGLGIYPRLLQHILSTEHHNSECIWIMHAPENTASEKGIRKAGFKFMGHVSIMGGTEVVLRSGNAPEYSENWNRKFGFKLSEEEPSTCWHCSSPYMKKDNTTCCCRTRGKRCNATHLKKELNYKILQK